MTDNEIRRAVSAAVATTINKRRPTDVDTVAADVMRALDATSTTPPLVRWAAYCQVRRMAAQMLCK